MSHKTLVMSQTPTQIKLRVQPADWPAQPEARLAAMRAATRELLAERGLHAMREPRLSAAGTGFTCEADLFPPVELPASLAMRCEIPALQPPGEPELLLALEGLQIRLGDAEPVSGPADWGMLLRVDMAGFVAKEAIPLSLQANAPMLLKQDTPNADFLAGMIGALPGETRVLTRSLAADFPHQPWRGAKAEYHVRVREILSLRVPPADDRLAQATGAGQSLSDLLAVLDEQLRQEARARWRDRLREAVVAELLKQARLSLPEAWVNEQLKAVWQASDGAAIKALSEAGFALPPLLEAASWESWQRQPWLKQLQGRNLKTQLVLREVGLKAGLGLDASELLRPLDLLSQNQAEGDLILNWHTLAESGDFPQYANSVWLDKVVRWLVDQAVLTQDGKPFQIER